MMLPISLLRITQKAFTLSPSSTGINSQTSNATTNGALSLSSLQFFISFLMLSAIRLQLKITRLS